jgi:hypothetical protein
VTSPSYYWGSQVKWKTASAVATGGPRDVKWKQDGAQLIPASTAIRTRPSSRNAVAVNRDERVKTRETVSRETVAQETVVRDKVARDKSESRDKSGSAEKSERVVKKDVVKKDTVKKPKAAKPAKEKSPQETVKPRESKQKRDVQRSRSARSESRYEIAMPAERVARKPERVVKPGRDDAPLRGDRFVSRERVRPERASRTAPPTRDHRMADRGGGHRGAKGR